MALAAQLQSQREEGEEEGGEPAGAVAEARLGKLGSQAAVLD